MGGEVEYVSHPLIRPRTVELRNYQQNITKSCLKGNTLVILPTGLGKTVIALLVVAERLLSLPNSRNLVVAPTKPLLLQHFEYFRSALNLDEGDFAIWTGEVPPEKRGLGSARIVFATPQVLQNDIVSGKLSLKEFGLLVVDEAHRTVGNYAYVFLVERYSAQAQNPLVIGLTASPGSEESRIEEVAKNIRASFIEARSDKSDDVKPYVQSVRYEFLPAQLPEPLRGARELLEDYLKERADGISKTGLARLKHPITYRNISALLSDVRGSIAAGGAARDAGAFQVLKELASARRVVLALERLDTEGVDSFLSFMDGQIRQSTRIGAPISLKRLFVDKKIKDAIELCRLVKRTGMPNPKLEMLRKAVASSLSGGARRVVVFASYRDSAKMILDALKGMPSVNPVRLVGQADRLGDEGMSQREQAEMLASFREGEHNVLVATQVGEEGLDISSSDVVVFYDNTPSAIRYIQRVGRTGRRAPGKAFIIYYEGTRDEAYLWIAKRREKRMKALVSRLSRTLDPPGKGPDERQGLLRAFMADRSEGEGDEKKVVIMADSRESGSPVLAELSRLGADIKLQPLEVGDYVLSERVCVERKTTRDFAISMMDGRLFEQARALKDYERAVLLLEGEGLYCTNVLPQAIAGALASLVVDFGLCVLWARNAPETANLLYALARKEQLDNKSMPRARGERRPFPIPEQQLYLLSGLPAVEKTTAKKLLEHFGTPLNVFNADEVELREVKGIGEIKANMIREVLTQRFREGV